MDKSHKTATSQTQMQGDITRMSYTISFPVTRVCDTLYVQEPQAATRRIFELNFSGVWCEVEADRRDQLNRKDGSIDDKISHSLSSMIWALEILELRKYLRNETGYRDLTGKYPSFKVISLTPTQLQ